MQATANPTVARDKAWKKFLAERSGPMELAFAAVTEKGGTPKVKPGRRELKERDLPKYLLPKLAAAKLKEWTGWTHYESVEVIPPGKLRKLPKYVQAIPTRFVLTDKNEVLRTNCQ